MEKEISVWFDKEGDYLEVTFGKPKKGYFKEVDEDLLQRVDSETGEIIGLAFINFAKHFGNMERPEKITLKTSSV